ncbi:zinc finger CCCH domain-containing protein 62-like [Panicum miliaceum]|uniref:Zinc finger CCCH domain-containing protein 62-like n=1 Tax=Panicum miliaceum TaxID=4540 RepID=A0A3L6S9R3_PANMI|nr:zinc finger CCCH domain-containing protein 62-like [Panicum miliaceum]
MAAAAAEPRAGHLPRSLEDRREDEGSEDSEEEEDVESDDEGSEVSSLSDFREPDAGSDEDPTFDPAADGDLEVEAVLLARMSRMSISASARRGRKGPAVPKLGKEEIDLLVMVDKLKQGAHMSIVAMYRWSAGETEGLRMQTIDFVRSYPMPIDVLTLSCASHTLRVKNDGEEKYPVSSFVLNCKGDACKGDVVMFEQNIYRSIDVGKRELLVKSRAAYVVKGSMPIEILWSKGYKPWPPLHPLLIKGRNLYKDKTMRQPWPDEVERNRVIQEKHERGDLARKSRAARIHEKENKKLLSLNRNRIKDNKIKEEHNMNQKQPQEPQQSQNVKSTNILQQRVSERKDPSPQNGEPGNTRQQHISSKATTSHHNKVFPQKGATRTFKQEFNGHQISSNQHGGSQPKVLSDPTHTQQMFKDHHHGYQQRNEVLPQEVPMRTSRKAFVDHQAPSQHNGGLGKTNHHQISSKHTPSMLKYPQ